MKWVMQVILTQAQADKLNLGSGHADLVEGSTIYVKAYDVDAYGGIGEAELTTDIDRAMHWNGPTEVIKAWRTQSTVRPLRGDGKQNRPLTAYTMSPVRV